MVLTVRFWQLQTVLYVFLFVVIWTGLGPFQSYDDVLLHQAVLFHQAQQTFPPPVVPAVTPPQTEQQASHGQPPPKQHSDTPIWPRSSTSRTTPRKIHLYLLAGQSNMLGFGSLDHLQQLIPEHPDLYSHLWTVDLFQWVEKDNVFVVNDDTFEEISPENSNSTTAPTKIHPARALTLGLGMNASFFGPEVGFGWTLVHEYDFSSSSSSSGTHGDGPATEKPIVLLVKAAWNSKSLAVDFRPPSAGVRTDLTNFRNDPVPPERYGSCYRDMMQRVQWTMENLPTLLPNLYDDAPQNSQSSPPPVSEWKGMVWFQGWNDRVPETVLQEYSSNLQHLIQDVRQVLQTPRLPVVIGGLGQVKKKKRDQEILARFVQQQQAAANSTKHAIFVPTAHLFHPEKHPNKYGTSFHYYGHADTVYHMGRVFGEAMLKLQQREAQQEERASSAT